MISTINIRSTLQKLGSTDYFVPAFECLATLPEFMPVEKLASAMYSTLDNDQLANVLSQLLTIESGSEDEIEGVEFTTDEVNDSVSLFHEICESFPEIVERAQSL